QLPDRDLIFGRGSLPVSISPREGPRVPRWSFPTSPRRKSEMKNLLRQLFGPSRTSQGASPTSARPNLETLEDRTVPAVLDLTTVGASGAVGSVMFQQTDSQPTGS